MGGWERKWKINDGFLGLEDAEFALAKVATDANDRYEMRLTKCADAETWSACRFIQRGYVHLAWDPQAPLPAFDPFNPTVVQLYHDGIKIFLERAAATTRRLEGVIEILRAIPAGVSQVTEVVLTPTNVTLLIAKDAVRHNGHDRDLLIVVFRTGLFTPLFVTAPDGTGHGDPT
jgi:hypothetical protein